ncbi:unnamed protein product, partial [Mesorhabditis belari]|uniref:Insulin-like domain-containing protein n=1 Tax=Mesorhabditis belari TaxID=2138241 RepID=A0AAF3EUE2_9BILA
MFMSIIMITHDEQNESVLPINAETPLEELDRLIEKQVADESADNSEFQFSRYRRTLPEKTGRRYCGRALILKLIEVCNGCTGPISTNNNDNDNENDTGMTLRKKRDVHEHHHEHSRRTKRAGLAEKCCLKTCTIDTFKAHCAPC